jgi:protein-S-isoprenylcysteine O-methyltransferase Ste14
MADEPDTAHVIAPPPLVALVALAIGLGLQWVAPASTLGVVPGILRSALAVILMCLGGVLMSQARAAFIASATPIEPWKPTAALATSGVFAHVRNPMYSGVTFIFLGLALALSNDWLLLATIVMGFVLHYGVVLREERYLGAKFGDDYRSYEARVPRYGWRG